MVDTTTVAAAAAAAAATNAVAGIAAPPVCPLSPAWALTLDGILLVAIFLTRISLLSFVVRLISRHTADISFGKSVFVALCMTGIFGFLYVAPEWKPFATALFVSTVVGTLFCKFLFWIGFERSLYACLIYSIISGALADLPHRYLDIQLPGRATITLALAEIVDNRVRRRTEDPTLPASPSLHAALGRWSTSTNENVLSQFILGPPPGRAADPSENCRDQQGRHRKCADRERNLRRRNPRRHARRGGGPASPEHGVTEEARDRFVVRRGSFRAQRRARYH